MKGACLFALIPYLAVDTQRPVKALHRFFRFFEVRIGLAHVAEEDALQAALVNPAGGLDGALGLPDILSAQTVVLEEFIYSPDEL